MRTLFFKLFFWFWLALSLSGLFFFLLAITMHAKPLHEEFRRHMADEHLRFGIQELRTFAKSTAATCEQTLPPFAKDCAVKFAPPGMELHLFHSNGHPLAGTAPPQLTATVSKLLQGTTESAFTRKERTAAAVYVTSPSGTRLVAAGFLPPPPPQFPPGTPSPLPPDFWPRILISLFVGGVVCYGLAWHLTRPVRTLRRATRQLADGDLSVRVPVNDRGSGSEVADLSREFNRMADQIEHLITSRRQLNRDISHELRSPLARLNVALGLARRDASSTASAALDRIEREADLLNDMIGELLTLNRLESNEDLVTEELDLAKLLEDVVHDADFEAASCERTVTLCAEAVPAITGNRDLLHRAVENVVRNGIRHTPPGTGVTVHLALEEPGMAVIRVRDRGPGVPEAVLTDIFRPFYRLDEARDRQSGGTGIGLAITEQALRVHGGTATAGNREGGGLEIILSLPIKPTK